MSFLTNTNIRQSFDSKILEILPLLNLTEKDIAWSNMKFQANPAKIFLKCFLLPAASSNVTLGNPCYVRFSGIYQINIFGLKNTGLKDIEHIADILLQEFSSGTILDCYGERLVIKNSYAGYIQEEETRALLPVSFDYFCETYQNTSRG